MRSDIHIGTAGWAVPRPHAGRFSTEGSLLQRYASRLHAVEVNTSFYRPHRLTTWAGWAAQTPDTFRFAVKAPRRVTHQLKLLDAGQALTGFVTEITALGHRLGPVLFQLPPSLAFDESIASAFLEAWRRLYIGATVFEPRHASWLAHGADDLLRTFEIARAAADPAVSAGLQEPGGWPGLVYWRRPSPPGLSSTTPCGAGRRRMRWTFARPCPPGHRRARMDSQGRRMVEPSPASGILRGNRSRGGACGYPGHGRRRH